MNMSNEELVNKFKLYCIEKYGSLSGTALSYSNAIKYLLEFLNLANLDESIFLRLKSLESELASSKSAFYKELLSFYSKRGQTSYLVKGFVRAAINVLFEYGQTISDFQTVTNLPLIEGVYDYQIKASYNNNCLKNELPTSTVIKRDYDLKKVNGTTEQALKKICNGRKAEKYFKSYLSDFLGFKENKDFFDVSNNKHYGFDIRLFDIGLEVKNIKNGAFYLTDNEIARLEKTNTHLILIDIDNGIWLLKNDSIWLKDIICEIRNIREFCSKNYSHLDLTDIKICIDNDIKKDVFNIDKCNKEELLKALE